MKRSRLRLIFLLITSLGWAQSDSSTQQSSGGAQEANMEAPAPGNRAAQRAPRREQMQEMCQEHLQTMTTNVQRMHASFDRMKANVAGISNADEKARWQANLDMWQTVLDHHDQMVKHMQEAQAKGIGCGMMMGDMGGGIMQHHGM